MSGVEPQTSATASAREIKAPACGFRVQRELIRAVRTGDADGALLALKKGAEPDFPDEKGCTPLMVAAMTRNADCARLLLPTANASLTDQNGRQALLWAVRGQDFSALANVKPGAWERSLECVKLLLGTSDPMQADHQGETPLIAAAQSGLSECVELLLPLSDAKHVRQIDGRTALIAAATVDSADCVRLLLARSDLLAADDDGMTALHWAAASSDENVECLDLLLGAGASVAAAKDKRGQSALHMAAAIGSPLAVERLLQQIDPRARNAQGQTALDFAASQREDDHKQAIVDALLKAIAEKERGDLATAIEGASAIAAPGGGHEAPARRAKAL
jgi:ankyrin repeat protein